MERKFKSNGRRNLNPMEEEIAGLGEEGRGWLRARAASSPAVPMGKGGREAASKNLLQGLQYNWIFGVLSQKNTKFLN